MSKQSPPSGNGISLASILFLIFLVLKLCGVITWSWWWVTAPLWGGLAIVGVIIIAFALVGVIQAISAHRK